MYYLSLKECNFLADVLKIGSTSNLAGRSILHACLEAGKAGIKLVPNTFYAGTDSG